MGKVVACLKKGFKAGLSTAWWITKKMLPITFSVAILKWIGFIALLAKWLTPALSHVGLSAEGVLVFITSSLTSLYASIGLIATLGIDFRMATILAVMGLICHNLIVETIIQRKAGANGFYIIVLRISAAIIAALVLNKILPVDFTGTLIIERPPVVANDLESILYEWMMSMVHLIPIMFGLIIAMNCVQQLLREFKIIDYLSSIAKPLMTVLGLSKQSAFLWIVMNSLGLAYGGAILISEYEESEISHEDARLLNTHVALNHSLLEDTLIFASIGIGTFWLFVPRLIMALIAVWSEKLYLKITGKRPKQSHNKIINNDQSRTN